MANVIKVVCHPERSAESAKSKDPFLIRNYGFFDSLRSLRMT